MKKEKTRESPKGTRRENEMEKTEYREQLHSGRQSEQIP